MQGAAAVTASTESVRLSCPARTQLEELISPKLSREMAGAGGQSFMYELVYPQGMVRAAETGQACLLKAGCVAGSEPAYLCLGPALPATLLECSKFEVRLMCLCRKACPPGSLCNIDPHSTRRPKMESRS